MVLKFVLDHFDTFAIASHSTLVLGLILLAFGLLRARRRQAMAPRPAATLARAPAPAASWRRRDRG
jgi:uncharacterized membrane protein